ncbi:AraC family transcriptional regulator [Paenibacillus bouchesdurhonensis]|uniref:AraC family transcriptional regulator n=1 Tax=Paenibacillus bouchesdurhonensis TaxID=1870990 RepID=UPI000DA5FC2E|nr:AraC family transcriptional regulator [Paenibacillus bouchesdurhonensis]
MEEQIYVYRDWKEKHNHGTPLLPVSLHHTSVPSNKETILYTHWHPECEFLIVLEGKAVFTIEDKKYHLKKSDGLFIPPKCLHSATHLDYSECKFFAVVFDHEFLISSNNTFLFNKYINPIIVSGSAYSLHFSCENSWQKDVHDLIKAIGFHFDHTMETTALSIKGKLLECWQIMYNHHFVSINNNSAQKKKQERLKSVFDYINEHYRFDISLADLSKLLSISEGQFCKIFKDVTGHTPFHYITRLRILKSCELLLSTDKKITEIADLTGFNNISYFNRTFKEFMNCSPNSYRKRSKS